MTQTIELPRTSGPDSDLGRPWNVIVRNDDHNTFEGVAAALARYIPGITFARGLAIAQWLTNARRGTAGRSSPPAGGHR